MSDHNITASLIHECLSVPSENWVSELRYASKQGLPTAPPAELTSKMPPRLPPDPEGKGEARTGSLLHHPEYQNWREMALGVKRPISSMYLFKNGFGQWLWLKMFHEQIGHLSPILCYTVKYSHETFLNYQCIQGNLIKLNFILKMFNIGGF